MIQANSIIDLDEAKIWLRIPDAEFDDIVTDLVNSVADKFETFTARKLKAQNHTEVYNGNGTNVLMVRNYPINSITSISFSSNQPRNFTDLLDVGVFEIDEIAERETVNFIGRRTPFGRNTIKIIYNGGLADPIQSDLKMLAKQAVEYFFRLYTRQDLGLKSVTKGDSSYDRNTGDLPPEIKEGLAPFVSMTQMNVLGAML